jgi:hypothetical protein
MSNLFNRYQAERKTLKHHLPKEKEHKKGEAKKSGKNGVSGFEGLQGVPALL